MLDSLYFAKFPDGGLYCANAAGPMAYEAREMAQEIADTISGEVVERTSEYAVNWCRERNVSLLVTLSNGSVVWSEETVRPGQGDPTKTVRVEGKDRERLIETGQRQRNWKR